MPYLCCCQKYEDMYSSEDLGRFYSRYQTEALPRGESVQSFCDRNKVPYNIFSKWYRDTRSWIVEVTVYGRTEENWTPSETQPESDKRPQRYRFCHVNNFTDMDCKYCFLSP
mgnify:CR=1 FL=1